MLKFNHKRKWCIFNFRSLISKGRYVKGVKYNRCWRLDIFNWIVPFNIYISIYYIYEYVCIHIDEARGLLNRFYFVGLPSTNGYSSTRLTAPSIQPTSSPANSSSDPIPGSSSNPIPSSSSDPIQSSCSVCPTQTEIWWIPATSFPSNSP